MSLYDYLKLLNFLNFQQAIDRSMAEDSDVLTLNAFGTQCKATTASLSLETVDRMDQVHE